MSKKRAEKTSERIKCVKCGFENPAEMKFCGNCGAKLTVAEAQKCTSSLESLIMLHLTGSLYLLISLAFNSLIRANTSFILMFVLPYLASTVLGLYAAYMLYKGVSGKYSKIISLAAIISGLVPTLILFIIGLGIRGVIGPAWIIFLVNAWLLWKKRTEI
ncbi:MAG: zinc ribbon domain-containing protein [Candidatus Bathyarchaeia archaeon]